MADFNGSLYDNYYSDNPPTKGSSALAEGATRILYDTYEASGEAIGSKILLGQKLGRSAVIHDVKVYNDALGASSTLAVYVRNNDDASEDLLATAASTSSAGIIEPVAANIANLPFQCDGNSNTILLLTAGGTVTGTIKIQVTYSES